MRKTTVMSIILATIAFVCLQAAADTVKVGTLPYGGARITGFEDAKLTFRVGGNPIIKPIGQVTAIAITGKTPFNQAEKLRTNSPAKAVEFYDKAAGEAVVPWEKRLIAYRRLDALGRTGLTERWAQGWAAMLAVEAEASVVKLRPEKLGDKSQIAGAIRQLEMALRRLRDGRAKAAISDFLEKLRKCKAAVGDTGAGAAKKPPKTALASPGGVKVSGRSVGRLRTFETMLARGDAARAMKQIDAYLKLAGSHELARTMFLSGAARMAVFGKTKDVRLLRRAGLMFMQVAVFYPESADAPRALYHAGEVCEILGVTAGATAAYKRICLRYPKSSVVKQAKGKLEALDKRAKAK